MKKRFFELTARAPSLANLSAPSLPTRPEWPLTHSKEVLLGLFHKMLMMGCSRLVWAVLAKLTLVIFSRSLHRVQMTHFELVLMCRWLVLGVIWSAQWMVRSSAELLDWVMFLFTGVAEFHGSFFPNHTAWCRWDIGSLYDLPPGPRSEGPSIRGFHGRVIFG